VGDVHFASLVGAYVVIHGSSKGKRREENELDRVVPMPEHQAEIRSSVGALAGVPVSNPL